MLPGHAGCAFVPFRNFSPASLPSFGPFGALDCASLSYSLPAPERKAEQSQGQEMHRRGLGKMEGESIFQPSTAGKPSLDKRGHAAAEVVVINVEWVLPGIEADGWLMCAPWWP